MKKIILLIISLFIISGCGSTSETKKIDCEEKNNLVSSGAVLVDVRTPSEYSTGDIEGAINLDSVTIMDNIENEIPDKDTKIILYCRSGNRSSDSAKKLIEKGYKNVYDLGGISTCSEDVVK